MFKIGLKNDYFVRRSSTLTKEILRRAEHFKRENLLKNKRSSFLYDANAQIENFIDKEIFNDDDSVAAAHLLKFIFIF